MANVAKVAMSFRIESVDAFPPDITSVVTFHAKRADGAEEFGEEARTTLALRVLEWWVSDEMPEGWSIGPARNYYPGTLKLERIQVQTVQPFTSSVLEYVPDPEVQPGDGGGSMAPPALAYLVTLRSDTNTRRGRGRLYLPAILQASTTFGFGSAVGGVLIGERRKIGQLVSLLAKRVRDDEEDAFNQMVMAVYSRVEGTANAVLRFDVHDRFATQRRRMPAARSWTLYDLNGVRQPSEELGF